VTPSERFHRYARRQRRQGQGILAFIAFFILWDIFWLRLNPPYWWVFVPSLALLVWAGLRVVRTLPFWKALEDLPYEQEC
jgi:hypothetical protein